MANPPSPNSNRRPAASRQSRPSSSATRARIDVLVAAKESFQPEGAFSRAGLAPIKDRHTPNSKNRGPNLIASSLHRTDSRAETTSYLRNGIPSNHGKKKRGPKTPLSEKDHWRRSLVSILAGRLRLTYQVPVEGRNTANSAWPSGMPELAGP